MTPTTPGEKVDSPAMRKDYMRRVYPTYWLNRSARIQTYDRNLCDLVASLAPTHGSLLEVASGTGYPFSQDLHRRGYHLHGVDIADSLIRESYHLDAGILACVGDAEKLPFLAQTFDSCFCFHSTFYFPDLSRALDEMIRVTRVGGTIVFDIQNANHPAIARAYARRRSVATGNRRWLRYGKNIAKIALRRGFADWSSVIREVPSDWRSVAAHLLTSGVFEITRFGRGSADNLDQIDDDAQVDRYARLVYVGRI
jgi:ubiquinone/menaquinone biosynthesis C-methylase UbiE